MKYIKEQEEVRKEIDTGDKRYAKVVTVLFIESVGWAELNKRNDAFGTDDLDDKSTYKVQLPISILIKGIEESTKGIKMDPKWKDRILMFFVGKYSNNEQTPLPSNKQGNAEIDDILVSEDAIDGPLHKKIKITSWDNTFAYIMNNIPEDKSERIISGHSVQFDHFKGHIYNLNTYDPFFRISKNAELKATMSNAGIEDLL